MDPNAKISITGDLGSGKSSVSKILSRDLGFPIMSTGSIQREMARKIGVSTVELNELAKKDPEIDKAIDAASLKMNDTEGNYILDSRMAWFFVKNSYKIYLKVSPQIASERIFKDESRNSESYTSLEDAFAQLSLRRNLEVERFIQKYGVDYSDISNYDLVVNTEGLSPEIIARFIIDAFSRRLVAKDTIIWCSPKILFPLKEVSNLSLPAKKIEETGLNPQNPILALEHLGRYYIYDGHKKTGAAILNALPFVPIRIIGKGRDKVSSNVTAADYCRSKAKLIKFKRWEERYGFKFSSYPSLDERNT